MNTKKQNTVTTTVERTWSSLGYNKEGELVVRHFKGTVSQYDATRRGEQLWWRGARLS